MKKIINVILVLILLMNVIPVHALTYTDYNKGDKITVNVNDTTKLEFYVMEDSKDNNTVKAIYSEVLDGTYNYENAKTSVNNIKSTWKNVSSVSLPEMKEIFGSNVDLGKSFTYTTPTWALSNSKYWTSNEDVITGSGDYLKDTILENNTVQTDTNIDFGKISSDTNGKGLYSTSLRTENNKVTYYFRGDVENNYVEFGKYATDVYYGYYVFDSTKHMAFSNLESCEDDQLYEGCTKVISKGDPIIWRIVRINEDGSIRLVTQDIVGGTVFNEKARIDEKTDNAYVGYMYGTIGSSTYEATHANTNNSTLKTYLDNWYVNNLKTNYEKYLADAGFCNDRSMAKGTNFSSNLGYGNKATYYAAIDRFVQPNENYALVAKQNANPQFICPQTNDLFTTNKSTKGNKALTYPIGTLTIDEIVYAGGIFNQANKNMYLINGADFYSMTPFWYSYGGFPYSVIFKTNYDGNVNVETLSISTLEDSGVRPVINLKSDVITTSGNGSSNSPYKVDLITDTEVAWTLGGTTTGTAEMQDVNSKLSIKPVITISKEFVVGGTITPDDENDEPTIPDDGGLGEPEDDNNKEEDNKQEVTNPETGDDIMIILGATAIVGYVAIYGYRKRKINI